jgi:hypothetical protein
VQEHALPQALRDHRRAERGVSGLMEQEQFMELG